VDLRGPISKGREGKEEKGKGKGREKREWERGEGVQ